MHVRAMMWHNFGNHALQVYMSEHRAVHYQVNGEHGCY